MEKKFIVAILTACAILSAQAQDVSSIPAAEDSTAQSKESLPNGRLSLKDCVQIGVEHNLDIQVARVAPRIARYSYRSSFAGYDPTLTAGYTYGFSKNPSSITPGSSTETYSSDIYSDRLNGGLSWLAPTGTRVNATGSYNRSGTSSGMYNGTWDEETMRGDQFTANGNLSLTQPLLKGMWIDSTRMGIKVARKNLDISQQTYELNLMNTILSIENAYFDLIGARENVIAAEQNLTQAEEFLQETLKKVEIGSLIELDSKDAESQASSAKTSLISMRQSYKTAANTLRSLLSDDFALWQDVQFDLVDELLSTPTMPNRSDSWYKGMTMRPELLQAKSNLEINDINVKYSFNQLFPQLDLVGSYGHSGASTAIGHPAITTTAQGTYPSYGVGGQLSVPLGNISARNAYKTRKAEREQQILTLKKTEQNIMVQIDNAINAVNSSYEAIISSRNASKYAKEAWEAGKIRLDHGKATSFEVLQLQTTYFQRRLSEITAIVSYNKQLAALRNAEGSTLEHYGIAVTYE